MSITPASHTIAIAWKPSPAAISGREPMRSDIAPAIGATSIGIAVLATVFAHNGSYASPEAYTSGMTSAIWVGAAVLAAGALTALLVPGRRGRREAASPLAQVEAAA